MRRQVVGAQLDVIEPLTGPPDRGAGGRDDDGFGHAETPRDVAGDKLTAKNGWLTMRTRSSMVPLTARPVQSVVAGVTGVGGLGVQARDDGGLGTPTAQGAAQVPQLTVIKRLARDGHRSA